MRYLINTLIFSVALFFQIASAQEIAFTFDDAPTEDGAYFTGQQRTEKILSHLKDNGVSQAAFFVVTKNIETNNGLSRLERYAAAGHLLANHTHTHRWIHNIGTATYIQDITKANNILKNMKGFAPWFRYPFLDEGRPNSTRDSIRAALKDLNLTNGYVTIDNYDWYINGQARKAFLDGKKINEKALKEFYLNHIMTSIEFYDQIAKEHLGRSPKHVLLLHENDLAAKFLGDLIKLLKSKGWKIISPTEAYTDPIATQVPDVLFNNQGRIAAIAREKGIPGRELVQESEDEEYLNREMNNRKIFE
jgi:peptidoglycan-N-acetylglucosamine deacetylase